MSEPRDAPVLILECVAIRGLPVPPDFEKLAGNQVESDNHPGLEPPRFGLKWMFLMMTVVAIAIAVWQAVGHVAGASLLLASLVLFAHVAGNVIGSQLRDRSTQHLEQHRHPQQDEPRRAVRPDEYAPVTRLSRRAPLGAPLFVLTTLGVIAGAVAGGYLLWKMHPEAATLGTLSVGCAASGAFGGLWAFWTVSLLQVVAGAWWQADRHAKTKRP